MNFVREILLNNWTLKLTAIFLAFFLWLSIHGDRDVERILTVPLEIRVPRNMEVTNERPSFVEVTVRGTPTSLGIWPSAPSAYTIDLQTAGEGTHEVPLSPGNVRIPTGSGLEVVRVSPPRIPLVLEQTVTREVAVAAPVLQGEPQDGFDVYAVVHRPTRVQITGPRSHVEPVSEVATVPVAVTGLDQSLRTFARLVLENHSLRVEPPGPVEVNIQIGVHRVLRTVSGVTVSADDEGWRVSPSRLTLQVLVPVTVKETLGPD
ncbi:MAG: CdaR family protein, partial [Acidobacteriota bacterium]